jgi:hypothetical protein
MKIHDRTEKVDKARRQVVVLLAELDLSPFEMIGVLSSIINDGAKYGVRRERHKNPCSAGGDEACGSARCNK